MQLPEKKFATQNIILYESDFESNRQAKPVRILQLLQDIATEHAQTIGLGWDAMNAHGMLWVLSKIRVDFFQPVTPQTGNFLLYTWPLAPNRFYAERCFSAVSGTTELFSATSMWSIISKEERKLLSAEIMNNFCDGIYSAVHSSTPANFARVRQDDSFTLCYQRTIFRSDLDHNGHVNNTNYITYAVDVLSPQEQITSLEIVYHRELKLGDVVQVFAKRRNNQVLVAGVRNNETCFTVQLTLSN